MLHCGASKDEALACRLIDLWQINPCCHQHCTQAVSNWLSQYGHRAMQKRAAQDTANLWSVLHDYSTRQLHRLRNLLEASFDPEIAAHQGLLGSIWILADTNGTPMELLSDTWKQLGFQGADPTTDIRAGGLLSVLNLANFAAVNGGAHRCMTDQIEARVAVEGISGYYPICTTSVNITKGICDRMRLSKARLGAIDADQLDELLIRAETAPLCDLWLMAIKDEDIGHTLAFFHVHFMRSGATYMDCGTVLEASMERLMEVAGHAGSVAQLQQIYREDPAIESLLSQPQHAAMHELGLAGREEWEARKAFALARSPTRILTNALDTDLERVLSERMIAPGRQTSNQCVISR